MMNNNDNNIMFITSFHQKGIWVALMLSHGQPQAAWLVSSCFWCSCTSLGHEIQVTSHCRALSCNRNCKQVLYFFVKKKKKKPQSNVYIFNHYSEVIHMIYTPPIRDDQNSHEVLLLGAPMEAEVIWMAIYPIRKWQIWINFGVKTKFSQPIYVVSHEILRMVTQLLKVVPFCETQTSHM